MPKKLLLALITPLLAFASNGIDSTQLSLMEKIGQLMVIGVTLPEQNEEFIATTPYILDLDYVKQMIKEYHLGGILFLGKSNPADQVALTNELQAMSKHPLFVFQDAEWGPSMRMNRDVIVLPRAMTLGALCPEDTHLIYACGRAIGKQLRAIGVQSSLSPVCDVNTNPRNPIINTRSFGEDPYRLAPQAIAMMRGLADGGTLPCAKHFPGHGNTKSDSHKTLPSVFLSKAALENNEFIPFQCLIDAGLPAIMIAHLNVPSLTNRDGIPTSLSPAIPQLLRTNMHFQGLIMTDGLGMQAVTRNRSEEEIVIEAINAGNDLLLCPIDIFRAIHGIKQAIANGIISEQTINEHVTRILHAKQNLTIERSITYDHHMLINQEVCALKKQLYTAAITLARNDDNRLPLKNSTEPINVVTIGESDNAPFIQTLKKYVPIHHFVLPLRATAAECHEIYQQVQDAPQVIISTHLGSQTHDKTMFLFAIRNLINRLEKKVTFVLFGNPYNLEHVSKSGATIVAYENEPEAQEAAALTLVGLHNPRGQLPVTGGINYPVGTSLSYVP